MEMNHSLSLLLEKSELRYSPFGPDGTTFQPTVYLEWQGNKAHYQLRGRKWHIDDATAE